MDIKNQNLIILLILIFNFLIRLFPIETSTYSTDYPAYTYTIKYFLENNKFPAYDQLHIAYPYFPHQVIAYSTWIILKFFNLFMTVNNLDKLVLYAFRIYASLFATLSVYAIMKFCQLFWKQYKYLPIIVGLVFAGVLNHIFLSKEIRGYIFGDFWGSMVLLFSYLLLMKNNSIKNYFLLGMSFGFAVSSHVLYFMHALTIGLAFLFNIKKIHKNIYKIILMVCTIVIAYLIANWHVLLNLNVHFDHPLYTSSDYRLVDDQVFFTSKNNYPTIFWYLDYFAQSGLGYITFISSVAGFFLYIIMEKKLKKIFFLFPIPIVFFFSITNIVKIRVDRYAIPLVIFCVIFASYFINKLIELSNKNKIKISIVVLIFLALPILKILFFDYLISQKSTREIAYEWIMKNIPKGKGIILTEDVYFHDSKNLKRIKNDYLVNELIDFEKVNIDELYDSGYEYILIGEHFESWIWDYKDYIQTKPKKLTKVHLKHFEEFTLKKEQNTELIKIFSNKWFDMGIFEPRYLMFSGNLNRLFNAKLKLYKFKNYKKNSYIEYSAEVLYNCSIYRERYGLKLELNKFGKTVLKLGKILVNNKSISIYDGCYKKYPTGKYKLTLFYYLTPTLNLKNEINYFGVINQSASPITKKELVSNDKSSLHQNISIVHEHNIGLVGSDLHFRVYAEDMEVSVEKIEIEKID
ncbi:MAG: hypothetical protein KDK90_04040 [Leptospiraceae bacterium]|nr:hypothetical protein [Leptospiraceae bacterium]